MLGTLLRPDDLAKKFPDKTPNYWAKLRCTGEGPEFLRIGSRIYYEESAVVAWLATKRRTSTSDPGPDTSQEEPKAPNLAGKPSPRQRRKAARRDPAMEAAGEALLAQAAVAGLHKQRKAA